MSKPALESIEVFFKTFESHLLKMREEGTDEKLAFRAQILLRQLEHFQRAILARPATAGAEEPAPLNRLLAAEDFNDLARWAVDQGERYGVAGVFFLSQKGVWERLAGDGDLPRKLRATEWIVHGSLGRAESGAFLVYLYGQARLAVTLAAGAPADAAMRLVRFLARAAPHFVPGPIVNPRPAVQTEVIAEDPAFVELLGLVETAARKDITVLLEGESGTGKEVIANFIHKRSARAVKPLITVNCAAIPAGLIESELFGHEKGAFTGAYQRQIGKVEQANGGTLFLDEIGEMELAMQAKLLRFLQLREFHRIGGRNKISVDTRVIAATNRDLKEAMSKGLFREDLYYRISVMPFTVPPLRARVDDIAPLTHFFVEKYARDFGLPTPEIEPAVMHLLAGYRFPGNVRELENLVQKALVLSKGNAISVDQLPEHVRARPPRGEPALDPAGRPRVWRRRAGPKRLMRLSLPRRIASAAKAGLPWRAQTPKHNDELKALKQDIQEFAKAETTELERRFLEDLLRRAEGSMPEASRLGGVNRTLLYKMLERTKG